MYEIVDHFISAHQIPLGCHMSDSFENHQFQLVAQLPNTTAVLSAIKSGGVPRLPIIFSIEG